MKNPFIQNIEEIIIENIDNESFGVVDIADRLSMSRFQLQRRFKKVTGSSVNVFIREVRLRKAKDLLKSGQYQVAEVAYQVGFSSPSYFTKCFIEVYGVRPSEVQLTDDANEDQSEPIEEKVNQNGSGKGERGRSLLRSRRSIVWVSIIIVILVAGTLVIGTGADEVPSLLEQSNSVLFLPVQIDDALTGDSRWEDHNSEMMDYFGKKTGMNTLFYSFDRTKITSDDQLLDLGSDLKVSIIVDMQFHKEGQDQDLSIRLINVKPPYNQYVYSYTGSIDELREGSYQAINKYIEQEQIGKTSFDLFDNERQEEPKINEKYQVAKLYYNLYRNTLFKEDFEIARRMASMALKEDPNNIELIKLLGVLYSESGGIVLDSALHALYLDSILILSDIALSIDSNYAISYQLRGLYEFRKKNGREANRYYQLAIEEDSTALFSYLQFAFNHLSDNDPVGAMQYWNLIEKHDKEKELLSDLLFGKALVYQAVGDIGSADKMFDELMLIAPENVMYWSVGLWHNIGQGRYDLVRKKVDQYCGGDPGCPMGHFYIEALLAEGRYEEAVPYLDNEYGGMAWRNSRTGDSSICPNCDRLVAFTLWRTGSREAADSILLPYFDWLIPITTGTEAFSRMNSRWDLALAYAFREDYKTSMHYLLKLEETSPYYYNFEWTKSHAVFKPLHDFPEYHELIERVDKRRKAARQRLYVNVEDLSSRNL